MTFPAIVQGCKFLTKYNPCPCARPFRIFRPKKFQPNENLSFTNRDFCKRVAEVRKAYIYVLDNIFIYNGNRSDMYYFFSKKQETTQRNTSWFQSPPLKVQIPHGI